jgi:hypothetical protein
MHIIASNSGSAHPAYILSGSLDSKVSQYLDPVGCQGATTSATSAISATRATQAKGATPAILVEQEHLTD